MAFQIQLRRGTASEWTSANPTLAAGEFGYESDTSKLKIGDGLTAWSSLSYFSAGSGDMTGVDITAGDGLDITQSNTTSGDYTATLSADLKANGGIVFDSTELAVDLGASNITGTLAAADGGTGLTSISTLLNSNTTKGDVGLGNVENTALSTWPGSGNITQVGTISSGTWSGTAIAYSSLSGKPSLGTASQYNTGIGSDNILQANAAVVDNDFLRVDGTKIEGRSASEVLSDIGAAASSHNHDASNDITSGTLSVARGGTGLSSISTLLNSNTTKSDVGLGNVENTALSTFSGSSNITQVGTITSGTWGGTAIAYADVSGTPTLGTAAAAATGDFVAASSVSAYGATLIDDADASAARTTLGLGNSAILDTGVGNTDLLKCGANVTQGDFLRINAMSDLVEGRTNAEVLSDIGAQAALTAPVTSPAMTGVSAGSITGVIKCSQSQYDAITPDANTLYVIV